MSDCSVDWRRNEGESVSYSAKKRLFVSEKAAIDFDDDLRPLSSSDESFAAESSNDEDCETNLCLSPSIHEGIENLSVNKSIKQSTPYSASVNKKTPANDDSLCSNVEHETPELSVIDESVNIPSKNASLADLKISFEDNDEGSTGITPSLFYGGSIPAVAYVCKVKTKLFENNGKGRVAKKYKRPVPLFSGVGHGIKKRKIAKPEKNPNIRDKMRKQFKLPSTRPVNNVKWKYNFSSLVKRNRSYCGNRKFFKSTEQNEQLKSKTLDDDEPRKKIRKLETDFKANDDEPGKKIRKLETDFKTNKLSDRKLGSNNFVEIGPIVTKHAADNSSSYNGGSYLSENYNLRTSTNKQHSLLLEVQNPYKVNKMTESNDDSHAKINNDVTKIIGSDNSSSKVKTYPVFNMKGQKRSLNDSPVLKEVTNNKGTRNKLKKAAFDENQFMIDAGQKIFGSTQCRQCEMIYQVGNLADEERHMQFHNSSHILKYKAWKNENVVGYRIFDRIIMVTSFDAKPRIQKIKDVLKHTEDEIGSYNFSFNGVWKAFLYIRDNWICGCLIAEPLKCAYRVAKEHDILLHAEEPQNVKCGINRIWTNTANRRQKIATELVNCLRKNFTANQFLTTDDIAFSATTLDGHAFAKKYVGKDYLIYT